MLDEILTGDEDKAAGSKSEFGVEHDEECSILEVGIYTWLV